MFIHDILDELREKYEDNFFARYLIKWLRKSWKGREHLFNKFQSIFHKRMDMMFDQLIDIYPDLTVQGENFDEEHTKEFKARHYPFMLHLAPIIHYKKLPNEIIIEIDNPSKSELIKVLERLKELSIEPLICWSGNKSWHIHILTYPENLTCKKEMIEYAKSKGVKEFTDVLYDIILRKTEIDGLDVGVQKHFAHWIRSPYSLNVKTIETDGKVKKKIGVKRPINGNVYRTWFFSTNIKILVDLEIEFRKRKRELLSKPIKFKSSKSKTYKWIEKILKNPELVKDGRKRLLWLAIVPYLVITNRNEVQVENICQTFVEKSGKEWKSEYRCLVSCMYRFCNRFKDENGQPFYPISLKNLIDKYPDLKYIADLVGGGGDAVSGMSSLDSEN